MSNTDLNEYVIFEWTWNGNPVRMKRQQWNYNMYGWARECALAMATGGLSCQRNAAEVFVKNQKIAEQGLTKEEIERSRDGLLLDRFNSGRAWAQDGGPPRMLGVGEILRTALELHDLRVGLEDLILLNSDQAKD